MKHKGIKRYKLLSLNWGRMKLYKERQRYKKAKREHLLLSVED